MEMFALDYQPWTGGGAHFAFFNQPSAAYRNFHVFAQALKPLIESSPKHMAMLGKMHESFPALMQKKLETMWASKLGLAEYDVALFEELMALMERTGVDYTIFFRELSSIPDSVEPMKKSFYAELIDDRLTEAWETWLKQWRALLPSDTTSAQMKQVNPKYILREWHLVEAYEAAKEGNYAPLREMQNIMNDPYAEQSEEVDKKYYRRKPLELFEIGGISHISCSS